MITENRSIEDIYRRKAGLFEELLHCIESERESLISLNIDNLWALMERKQKIIEAIDEVRGRIGSFNGNRERGHDTPVRDRQAVLELSKKIARLEEEIKVRAKENVSFIHDTLDFFGEVLSSLLRGGKSDGSYYPVKRKRKEISTVIYHKEV
ncbi:MAG: flagellar export chaperone FlgN [Pseudomonadota bacterium]